VADEAPPETHGGRAVIHLQQPILTDALILDIDAANTAAGQKPKAFDTPFRYSDAGRCAMAMALDYLEVPRSEPFDYAGQWVMWVGTMIHEHWQAAAKKRFPNCVAEPVSHVPRQIAEKSLSSGHADLLIPEATMAAYVEGWTGGDTLFELKTTGGFGFDSAVGVNRKSYRSIPAEGPKYSYLIQAGLNAMGLGATTVVIGQVALTCLSKGLMDKLSLSTLDRFTAEWIIEKHEWEPIARAEIDRMSSILWYLDRDRWPARTCVSDGGKIVELNPRASNVPWQCQYCNHRTTCKSIDSPKIDLPVELRRKRENV
jgi:hypothetical protein